MAQSEKVDVCIVGSGAAGGASLRQRRGRPVAPVCTGMSGCAAVMAVGWLSAQQFINSLRDVPARSGKACA